MMKFVYVLVSSGKDYIAEQTLVSIHSLRMYNPNAHVVLISDKDTYAGLTGNRGRINQYVDEFITPELPEGLNVTQKSRFLKTSLRKYIKGDLLYIDNDTVITGSLKELEALPYDMAAVLNQHREDWGEKNPHSMIRSYQETTGNSIEGEVRIDDYFNGGIIFAKDTQPAHDFFSKWHELWWNSSIKFGFHKDQPDMWKANKLMGNVIQKLDGKYNCQAIYPVYALPYLKEANIFHYFSSARYANHIKFKNINYLKGIRKTGITNETEEYIRNIKKHYEAGLKALTTQEREVYDSTVVMVARKMSNWKVLNKIIEILYKLK